MPGNYKSLKQTYDKDLPLNKYQSVAMQNPMGKNASDYKNQNDYCDESQKS